MYDETTAQLEPASAKTSERRSILVVDDDPGQVETLVYRLEKQGFETHAVYCGQDGLRVARSETPHLILLDLRLPDADGLDICQSLADDPATCDIPVIILSGMERPDIVRCSRAAGCRYYVRKPYDPNALLLLIEQSINESTDW